MKTITPKVQLSATKFTYNGKVRTPSVTVFDGNEKLASSQYTKTFSKGRKNVGKYTVKVTLKGRYKGSKTVTYRIVPKGTTISKLKKGKKAITVKWKKQSAKMATSRITGYQIQVAANSTFTKGKKTVTVKGYKTVSKKVTKLKAKKKYYVHVRTYKTINGKKYCSNWSKTQKITTK